MENIYIQFRTIFFNFCRLNVSSVFWKAEEIPEVAGRVIDDSFAALKKWIANL